MAALPASVQDGERPLRAGGNKPGLLTLTIKDKSALYLAYMPFVKNGGLFIPTNSNYRLGDEVFMLLNLMGEDEKLPVAGRVIWVTPKGAEPGQAHRRHRRAVQRAGSRPDAEEDRDLSRRRALGRQGHAHDVGCSPARSGLTSAHCPALGADSTAWHPPRSTAQAHA